MNQLDAYGQKADELLNLTKKEMVAICKRDGITGYGKLKRYDLAWHMAGHYFPEEVAG